MQVPLAPPLTHHHHFPWQLRAAMALPHGTGLEEIATEEKSAAGTDSAGHRNNRLARSRDCACLQAGPQSSWKVLECPSRLCTEAEKDGGGQHSPSPAGMVEDGSGAAGDTTEVLAGEAPWPLRCSKPVAEGVAVPGHQHSSVASCHLQLLLDPDTQTRTDLQLWGSSGFSSITCVGK